MPDHSNSPTDYRHISDLSERRLQQTLDAMRSVAERAISAQAEVMLANANGTQVSMMTMRAARVDPIALMKERDELSHL